jgi:transaldolase/glucose-6-phosphate isomerase
MNNNPLLKLETFGQSIWLDFIRRGLIDSGELEQFINEDGLLGVTSNPSIFEKAISGSHDYDNPIRAMALEGKSADEIYRSLTVEDIRLATALFRPVYEKTQGNDGFVSLEVSPHLAHDTSATIAEARKLWTAVDHPNVLIKVPATEAGLPAIRELISQGINVNVTLLFGLPRYRKVAEAYLGGLEDRISRNKPIQNVASVASFFLSRIDVKVDPMLEKFMQNGDARAKLSSRLHGQIAISSAKVAYQMYQEIFGSERFKELATKGGRPQRLLWASTSTKNPSYSDVKYVEALIGPHTVNTMPLETLHDYRDHGNPDLRLETGVDIARENLSSLSELNIDIGGVTQELEDEGVEKFIKPYDKLMGTLEEKRKEAEKEPVDPEMNRLSSYSSFIRDKVGELQRSAFSRRLWQKDPSLWKTDPKDREIIRNGLGWLHSPEKMAANCRDLLDFAEEIKSSGFRHVVHMGMGGSSLAPLVFQRTFSPGEKGLPLTVLDTTDPSTILKIEAEVPLENTLFIVASKSGTTAEPLAFGDYFYDKVKAIKQQSAGENFVAITDPETHLARLAAERKFRRTFLNFKDIGGRYSALSYFGLVPAALHGIDIEELLERALRMAHAAASSVPAIQNPALSLGASLGVLAEKGRDKLTFFLPKSLSVMGMWLEQLLAESTGKEGKGILPVAAEPPGPPAVYGQDRVFVFFRMDDQETEPEKGMADSLAEAGHPVITIALRDALDLGQEFMRWEVATATAGAVLEINAFDQPNVQESKDNTDRVLRQLEEKGTFPDESPTLVEAGLQFFSERKGQDAGTTLAGFFGQTNPGDYVAVQAYLTEKPETDEALQEIRLFLRDSYHVATTLGYGPRFLHSTGQFHKGGPNTGLFLQLTADDPDDAVLPGKTYSFGQFKLAQALGDLEALRKHGRRVMRVHLGSDVQRGLSILKSALEAAKQETDDE